MGSFDLHLRGWLIRRQFVFLSFYFNKKRSIPCISRGAFCFKGSLNLNKELSLVNGEINSCNNSTPFPSAFHCGRTFSFVKFGSRLLQVPNTWQRGWITDYYIFTSFSSFPIWEHPISVSQVFLFLLSFTFRCFQRAAISVFTLTPPSLTPMFSVTLGKPPVSLENWFIAISMI